MKIDGKVLEAYSQSTLSGKPYCPKGSHPEDIQCFLLACQCCETRRSSVFCIPLWSNLCKQLDRQSPIPSPGPKESYVLLVISKTCIFHIMCTSSFIPHVFVFLAICDRLLHSVSSPSIYSTLLYSVLTIEHDAVCISE